jgi:CheY-like chemotaxis protein/DNA-binding XRE family transcriptional regulator
MSDRRMGDSGEFAAELARFFSGQTEAEALLEEVQYPRGLMPNWHAFADATRYWSHVLWEIEEGQLLQGGPKVLARAAFRQYPGNAVFVVAGKDPQKFGGLLQRWRSDSRLTREELARASGVSARVISNLERGVHKTPRTTTVLRLADALGLVGSARDEFESGAREVEERSAGVNRAAPTYRSGQFVGHVFISYVREDADQVDRLQHRLEEAGIRVWRDTADLWPGEDWRTKIRQAILDDALVFIACFSRQSLARARSYQNEELTLAIEQLRRRNPEDPWLIPVRFDDCDIPERDIGAGRMLTSIQRVDLFGDRSDRQISRLLAAITRIFGLGTALTADQSVRHWPENPVVSSHGGSATGPDPGSRATSGDSHSFHYDVGRGPGPRGHGMKARVLVVEDDKDISAGIRTVLDRSGFDVVSAADGEEGLRAFYAIRPELVVLNIRLDGWAVLKRIRDLSEVPVLILAAHWTEADEVRGLHSGADGYLTMPFGNRELAARLEALLRRPRIG